MSVCPEPIGDVALSRMRFSGEDFNVIVKLNGPRQGCPNCGRSIAPLDAQLYRVTI